MKIRQIYWRWKDKRFKKKLAKRLGITLEDLEELYRKVSREVYDEVMTKPVMFFPIMAGPSVFRKALNLELRKDDSNETTWYITFSTYNFIVSTYNNIFIPALCRVHTIPVSTDKTDYIIRKDD